ncbi:MAG: hypothetical protein M3R04_05660 [bacterium]|nr:hypothetical protein [bacterium]
MLRATIVLLAALAVLLCAADTPQPSSENQRDARKQRYSQRQQLTNDGVDKVGESDVSDPDAQLSLLPAGTVLSQPAEEKPNQLPQAGELHGGVTATVAMNDGLADTPAGNAAVRSLGIDGTPYGEQRHAVEKLAVPVPQQLASTSPLPTLRGSAEQSTKAAQVPVIPKADPATSLQKKAVPPASMPANDKKLATAQVPVKKAVPILVKPSVTTTKTLETTLPDVRHKSLTDDAAESEPAESTDGFKVLPGFLASSNTDAEVSSEQLRYPVEVETVAVDAPLFAEGGELLDGGESTVADTELGGLDIPGRSRKQTGGLGKLLLGVAVVLVGGVVVMAIPRPRRRRESSDGLTLIEKIGLSEGNELVILRKKHYAFVLGVTRSATHLLEKVSMASLDSDYNTVINDIIKRETESPELWRMRPLYSASYRTEHAPEERAAPVRRTSLSELRASLHVVGPALATSAVAQPATMTGLRERGGSPVNSVKPGESSSSRDAVIRKLREQARRAS